MKELSRIDMDSACFSIKTIEATIALIVDDMEQEHHEAKGHEEHFYKRMDNVYMPAINLVICAIHDLREKMEAVI